jgi:serine/threonine protein kinase
MWYMRLVCRDFKLENILLDKDGDCKLADFRMSEVGIFHGLKMMKICGTRHCMAPEVIIIFDFECDTFILCRVNLLLY